MKTITTRPEQSGMNLDAAITARHLPPKEFPHGFDLGSGRRAAGGSDHRSDPPGLKYSPDQPRDDHGRFAEVEGGGADALTNELNENGQAVDDRMDAENALVLQASADARFGERGAAKAAIAHDLAQRMSTSTDDLLGATNLLSGEGSGPPTKDEAKINWRDPNVLLTRDPDGTVRALRSTEVADQFYTRGGTTEAERVVREGATSALIASWMQTANDNDPQALAIQQAAIDEFGLQGTADWQRGEAIANATQADYEEHGEVYRDFLRSQYEATQERFAEHDVKEITVARGWAWDPDRESLPSWVRSSFERPSNPRTGYNEYRTVMVPLRPLSSWAMNAQTATDFADLGGSTTAVTYATVPVSQVLSTARTGFGALIEYEAVLLGGKVPMSVVTSNASSW